LVRGEGSRTLDGGQHCNANVRLQPHYQMTHVYVTSSHSAARDARWRYRRSDREGAMTPAEKVAQLLALARSTPFASERETAVGLARTLFNKYRLTDARLRWDLLKALGLEAGPEPARPQASSSARTADGEEDWAAWREWMAAEQAEQERWTRAWMKRAQRRQRADPTRPRRRASAPKTGTQRRRRGTSGRAGRQSKRVRVQGHASARTVWGVPSYTRETPPGRSGSSARGARTRSPNSASLAPCRCTARRTVRKKPSGRRPGSTYAAIGSASGDRI